MGGISYPSFVDRLGFEITRSGKKGTKLAIISDGEDHSPLLEIIRELGISPTQHLRAHQRK